MPSALVVQHLEPEGPALIGAALRAAGVDVTIVRPDRYPHQAFRLGPAAWGLQFHLEVDAAAVGRFVAAFGAEADDPEAIVAGADRWLARAAPARTTVLDRFAALVAGRPPG